jgi:acyl carrier protein
MLNVTTQAERRTNYKEIVLNAIAFVAHIRASDIDATLTLSCSGMDELDMTEMVMEIEDELGIEFDESYFGFDAVFAVTVQALLDEVCRLMAQ